MSDESNQSMALCYFKDFICNNPLVFDPCYDEKQPHNLMKQIKALYPKKKKKQIKALHKFQRQHGTKSCIVKAIFGCPKHSDIRNNVN